MKATWKAVERLKREWLSDPGWELAETPGFAEYKGPLRAYQRETFRRLDALWRSRRQAARLTGALAAALARKFPAEAVTWRLTAAGRVGGRFWACCRPEIRRAAIEERLTAVLGALAWRFIRGGRGMGIEVRAGELTFFIAGTTGGGGAMTEEAAFREAAARLGVGRYLLLNDVVDAVCSERFSPGWREGVTSAADGEAPFYWKPRRESGPARDA